MLRASATSPCPPFSEAPAASGIDGGGVGGGMGGGMGGAEGEFRDPEVGLLLESTRDPRSLLLAVLGSGEEVHAHQVADYILSALAAFSLRSFLILHDDSCRVQLAGERHWYVERKEYETGMTKATVHERRNQ